MLNKLKRTVGEVNNIRCSIVESGISSDRMSFLKELLEHNKFEVVTEKAKDDESKFVIGVTDVTFNQIYSIYDRILKTKNGNRVTPAYWNQETTICDPEYWVNK